MDRDKLRRKANRHPDEVSLLPEEVLELLDALEAQEKRIHELERELEGWREVGETVGGE